MRFEWERANAPTARPDSNTVSMCEPNLDNLAVDIKRPTRTTARGQ